MRRLCTIVLCLLVTATAATAGPVHPYIQPVLPAATGGSQPAPAQIPALVPQVRLPALQPTLYWTSVVTVSGATVADGIVTQSLTDKHIAREGNYFLATKQGTLNWPVFLGIAATTTLLNHKLVYRRGHPKLATAINFTITALHVAAVWYGAAHRR